ncbi:EamA family transporter RarD [Saccharicrinis aurantiacus]|uniref:EamA family transporter RarD n=1 Tax=Saccharicrinis aurantiacus TaxID=1849719 RepID=UPI002490DE92|nr:EamA family transporter RarD [Saccharicrinis aurantiacus]
MNKKSSLRGYLYVFQAFAMWGVLAIYWKTLKHIPSWELLSHRVIWSFIILSVITFFFQKDNILTIWKNKKDRYTLLISSVLIGINWGVFIYAVNANRIVEASLGYYITPLVNIFLGIVFLKEKLSPTKTVALVLAVTAVLFLAVQAGKPPFISLLLAFSFGIYGLIKKTTTVDTLPSLAFETTALLPIALGYQIYLFNNGSNHMLNTDIQSLLMLIGTGIITILPLYWFMKGAKKINLISVGFFQYTAPTIMLLIGIYIYDEPFNLNEALAFGIIWLAIVLYVASLVNDKPKSEK